MAKVKVFENSSKVKVKGHKVKNFVPNGKVLSEGIYMCNMKGLTSSYGSEVMAKVKVFKNSSKVKVKGHKVKNFVPNRKVLSEGIYMCNVKGLALTCLLYTSPSPRDGLLSRMPSSA